MTNLQSRLIEYFKRNKKYLYVSFKEIKKDILKEDDEVLKREYSTEIYNLKFYGLI